MLRRPPIFWKRREAATCVRSTMYKGTLIQDLLDAVDRAESVVRASKLKRNKLEANTPDSQKSEAEQVPQTLGLSAANGNLALLLVVHPQLVGTLEPGHHLANAVDIDEIGAVGPPEKVGV